MCVNITQVYSLVTVNCLLESYLSRKLLYGTLIATLTFSGQMSHSNLHLMYFPAR